jgi:hypothetical protein
MAKPSGDPFADMCTMVGVMTITWAWAENWLALSLWLIDEAAGDIHGHPEAPISLKKRLSYLRIALRDVSVLESAKQEGAALIKLFKELAPRRHEIVHGTLYLMPQGGFESSRLAIRGREYSRHQKRVEIADVVQFNVEVNALAQASAGFNIRLRRIFEGQSGRPVTLRR